MNFFLVRPEDAADFIAELGDTPFIMKATERASGERVYRFELTKVNLFEVSKSTIRPRARKVA